MAKVTMTSFKEKLMSNDRKDLAVLLQNKQVKSIKKDIITAKIYNKMSKFDV